MVQLGDCIDLGASEEPRGKAALRCAAPASRAA